MANQVSVSSNNTVQVSVEPTPNVEVTISRTAVGTIANVPTANYANFAGNVVNAAQPNITSVGNLTSLNVTGTTTTGNLVVLGNLQVGNLVANTANYANFAGTAFAVAGANVSGEVANANFATTAGSANTANTATVANSANAVAGANVSGTVANAAYADNAGNANFANTSTVANSANSVTLANVSGAGNIASINLDGNVSNVLKGDGTFGPEGSTGNANYANFAGNAFSVDGSNVVGAVANATFALDAGNANIANIAYSVDVANVSGIGNIATINLDGNVANALLGDGTFGAVELTTANYANFAGDVVNSAQPNITSVGTLTALTANTSTPISITGGNGNIEFNVINSSNTAGRRVAFAYTNPVTFQSTVLGADEAGFGYYIANNAPGNVGTGNIKSYWQFLADGTFRHTVGGSGNIIAKNLLLGNVFTGQFNGNIIAGNGNIGGGNISVSGASGRFIGNASGLTNIPGANVTGTVANATYAANAGNANIANIAYSVDGANVTGTVANATFALDAGNANIANIAYSVDGANVSGTVANATFALDAGNANIANIAYSVDVANVSGIGNIATINLDGNVSNLLTGNGTFVAIPTDVANANYANFAGTVLTNAQPNITSVGTLIALDANTTTPINVTSTNGNVSFRTINNANTAGRRVQFAYDNPTTNLAVVLGADEGGFGYYISNTAPGNVGTGNIRSYWQFLTNGDFRHTVGGTGNITAKNLLLGNVFTGQFNGNIVAGTGNLGIGNINASSSINGNTFTATASINARNGSFTGVNGGAIQTNINNVVNCPDITFNRYDNNAAINNYSVYRTRGTNTSPTSVQPGDTLFSIYNSAYSNIGFEFAPTSTYNTVVNTNDGAGNITVTSSYNAQIPTGSTFNINYGQFNATGNASITGDVNIGNGNVQVIGRQIQLSGANTGPGNISSINLINGALNWTLDNTNFGGGTPFGMNRYISGFMDPMNYFTARGNPGTPVDVQIGDTAFNERVQVRYNGGTSSIFNSDVSVRSFSPSNTVASTYAISSYDDQANSVFQVNFGTSNIAGNLDVSGNINLTGRLLGYDLVYGDFYSNVTQTNPNVSNVNLMTFNNTGSASDISIVSNSQITIAKAGIYNIQFSAQLSQTSGGTKEAYIWLRKNGSDVPYTTGESVVSGNGDKIMAAWNYVVTASAGDNFELAWNATDTSVVLESVAPAGIIPGIASVIVTITPVGA